MQLRSCASPETPLPRLVLGWRGRESQPARGVEGERRGSSWKRIAQSEGRWVRPDSGSVAHPWQGAAPDPAALPPPRSPPSASGSPGPSEQPTVTAASSPRRSPRITVLGDTWCQSVLSLLPNPPDRPQKQRSSLHTRPHLNKVSWCVNKALFWTISNNASL